ncbi:FAD-binding oxidoreductase [bacterium]|nr:FAD-binding oxidoreductase [bacterium]
MSTVLTPSTTDELATIVRDSVAAHRSLAVRGAGRWALALTRASGAATPLSMATMSGIVEYVPGDLTLTARAGTTLAEIEGATRANGQWCPLLPDPAVLVRIDAFRRGPYVPLACEVLSAEHAGALGLGAARLVVRVGGNSAFVAESVRRIAELGTIDERAAELWTQYRALDPQRRHFTNAYNSPLAARVKRKFDPHGILNPNVLGEVAV